MLLIQPQRMLVVVHVFTLYGLVLVPELQKAEDGDPQQHADEEEHTIGGKADEQHRDHGNRRDQASSARKHTRKTVAGRHGKVLAAILPPAQISWDRLATKK